MSSLAGVTPFPPEFAARSRARGYWEDVPLGRFYAGVFASRALIAQIREAHSGVRTILSAETIRDLLRSNTPLDARLLDTVEVDPDEPCILQLSGGTTGVPKLIPRTNNDYVYNTKAAVAVNDVHADDCLLVALPIAHNFPLACPGISGFFWKGARVVLTESPRADDV